MPRVVPLLVLVSVLLAVLPSGSAIRCYKCSDLLSANSDVLNWFSSLLGLPPCTEFQLSEARFRDENCPNSNTCVKMVKSGGTVRSCLPGPIQDSCSENGQDTACVCSTDYCNAAGRSAPALLLLLVLPAALLALLNSRL